jgi:hypothetical protein
MLENLFKGEGNIKKQQEIIISAQEMMSCMYPRHM